MVTCPPFAPPTLFNKTGSCTCFNSRARHPVRVFGVRVNTKPTEGRRAGGGFPVTTMAFSAVASILAILAAFPVASQAHTECSTLSLVQPPTVALDPNVALMVGPTLLFESGEWVTVSWTGIEAWMFPDAFIAAFSPGTPLDDPDTITDVAPVKYQFLTAGKPYPGGDLLEVESAVGGARNSGAVPDTGAVSSLRFRLLNLRDVEGYRFGLFTGGVEAPVLVAKTKEAVTFAQPFEVRSWYIHI